MTNTLGQRIRQIRKEKKMTLKELSAATGVSISFLSQLELNKTNATLETLRKISTHLEVHPSIFFDGIPRDETYPFHYQDLSNAFPRANFKAMKVLLRPSENIGEEISHLGHEFIYVLSGRLTITIEGESYLLSAHQSKMLDATNKHYWKNESSEDVEFLVVTSV
ncbi:MAG: helix-turn-helix domain-containing protein [Lysinibacillus sp.]